MRRVLAVLVVAFTTLVPAHAVADDVMLFVSGGKIVIDQGNGKEPRILAGSFRQAAWMKGLGPVKIAAVTTAGNVNVIDLVAGKHQVAYSSGDALIVSSNQVDQLVIAAKGGKIKLLDLGTRQVKSVRDLSKYGVLDDINADMGAYCLMYTGSGKQTVSRIIVVSPKWSVTGVLVTPAGVCLKAICWSKRRNALLVAGMANAGTYGNAAIDSEKDSVARLRKRAALLADIQAGRREIFIAQLPAGSKQMSILYVPYTNAERDWSVIGMTECSDGGIIIGLRTGGEDALVYTMPPPSIDECTFWGDGLWPCTWWKQQ